MHVSISCICAIALDQEDEGGVLRSSKSYIRLVSWFQAYRPENNNRYDGELVAIPLCMGGVRAFLEDEDQEALELI